MTINTEEEEKEEKGEEKGKKNKLKMVKEGETEDQGAGMWIANFHVCLSMASFLSIFE